MDSGPASPRDLEPVARLCGAVAIALGLAILIGWATGLEQLTRIAPALPAATPNSAIMFVACGLALRGRLVIPCGALVVAIAGATLIEHATGASLGIDNLFGIDVPEVAQPGRPATHTAAAFLLLGLSLLVTGSRSRAGDIASGALTAGAAAVIGLAVAGYLVGVDYLLGNSSAHGMAVPHRRRPRGRAGRRVRPARTHAAGRLVRRRAERRRPPHAASCSRP